VYKKVGNGISLNLTYAKIRKDRPLVKKRVSWTDGLNILKKHLEKNAE
jgi:hypothetical protein